MILGIYSTYAFHGLGSIDLAVLYSNGNRGTRISCEMITGWDDDINLKQRRRLYLRELFKKVRREKIRPPDKRGGGRRGPKRQPCSQTSHLAKEKLPLLVSKSPGLITTITNQWTFDQSALWRAVRNDCDSKVQYKTNTGSPCNSLIFIVVQHNKLDWGEPARLGQQRSL